MIAQRQIWGARRSDRAKRGVQGREATSSDASEKIQDADTEAASASEERVWKERQVGTMRDIVRGG